MTTDPKPGQRARITVEAEWVPAGYWWITGPGHYLLPPEFVLAWEPMPDPMPEWVSTPGTFALAGGEVWQRGIGWRLDWYSDPCPDEEFWAMGPTRLVPEASAPDPDTKGQA